MATRNSNARPAGVVRGWSKTSLRQGVGNGGLWGEGFGGFKGFFVLFYYVYFVFCIFLFFSYSFLSFLPSFLRYACEERREEGIPASEDHFGCTGEVRITPRCETDATEPSDAEEFNTPLRKKRGRPIKLELQRLEEEIRTAQEILNSAYDPADFRSKKRTVMAQRLEEEMSHLPPRDIVAQVFVRILREAALKIQVGTDALIGKQPTNLHDTEKEINTENQEIQRLKDEISVLREELKTLKNQKEAGQISSSIQQENMEIEPSGGETCFRGCR
ncbi:hypothetical protein PUN28_020710 [Cardiocondyla obscurior]|uniref:Uncharacterized protein n=1 Tax=Cardiocondyla obscurior TaxID=286306 RepID=A0AAW2E512_9HYME